MVDRKGKPRNFETCVWIIVIYLLIIFLTICISYQTVTNSFHKPTHPIQGKVSLKKENNNIPKQFHVLASNICNTQ